MSSPAPNRSPTSFIAGSSTSFSTPTAARRVSASSMRASMPSGRRWRIWRWMPLLGALAGEEVLGGELLLRALRAEVGDEPGERVRAAVEDELLGERPLHLADGRVRADVLRVHDGEVEPRLDRVVEEDRVHDLARRLGEAEGDVRDAEGREHARVLRLDAADPLERLDGAVPVLLAAGGEGEGERVEDEGVGADPVVRRRPATMRRAISALRSAVCAIPFSSMVMATTAAP